MSKEITIVQHIEATDIVRLDDDNRYVEALEIALARYSADPCKVKLDWGADSVRLLGLKYFIREKEDKHES